MSSIPVTFGAPTATAAASPVASVRIVAANLTALPVGELLRASVTQVGGGEAAVSVNGQTVTVRPPGGLQVGGEFLVRIAATGQNPSLEILGVIPQNPTQKGISIPASEGTPGAVSASILAAAGKAGNPGTSVSAPISVPTAAGVASRGVTSPVGAPLAGYPAVSGAGPGSAGVAVADVISSTPDGRVLVRVNGQELAASTSEPLTTGGRYLVQVQSGNAGPVLRPLPPTAGADPLPVATAVLRSTPSADLSSRVRPLLAEIATPTQPEVRTAAAGVRETVQRLLPEAPRPLLAREIQALVEDGGLQYEAKLASASVAAGPGTERSRGTSALSGKPMASENGDAARHSGEPTATRSTGDLKGDLLRLLDVARTLGEPATSLPVSREVLQGIEFQQAANIVAQQTQTPYFLQIPVPDGDTWTTANLTLDPDRNPGEDNPDGEPSASSGSRGFRMMMHVALSELGETWVEAGSAGGSFRAVLYLENADARDRVRGNLEALRAELQSGGFGEVLLDVRSSRDLPDRHRGQAAATRAGRPGGISTFDARA